MAPTARRDPPVVLDITRLTSRVGFASHTGVDRVEQAYLDWCLATEAPIFGLARIAGGHVLLDRAGLKGFSDRLRGITDWGRQDFRASVGLKTRKQRGQAESDLRRLSISRSGRRSISSFFDHLPQDIIYLNTGHSNITAVVYETFAARGYRIATFVHDIIPLEYPDFQTPDSMTKFKVKIDHALTHSNLVITNSRDTILSMEQYFTDNVKLPRTIAAHLGITVRVDTKSAQNSYNRPYFVTLGTIEPRKNHALLLEAWDLLKAEMQAAALPTLHIVGRRGWSNRAVFKRLDETANDGTIIEHNDMGDDALWPLVAGSNGLLFPSLAEGFGLPSLEAAALGVPVVCGDLAIHRELLGAYPVYAELSDTYAWKKTIVEMANQRQESSQNRTRPPIPTWEAHFELVNEALTGLA